VRSHAFHTAHLGLLLAAHLLGTVLGILAGTAAQLLLLHVNAGAHLTVLGLELLHLVKALVDEAESCSPLSLLTPLPSF